MTLIIPRLDDRSYEQLADLLRRQLTSDEWTDHNASDPGIMLLELLAWLGEMALYRMDRVPQSHRDKFLNFIIDPPEPVTLSVTFQATFDSTSTATSATVGAGTMVATDYALGRRFVFETFENLTLDRPPVAPPPGEPITGIGSTRARAILEVLTEELGISTGAPNQVFDLWPPRRALRLDDDDPAPLLVDFIHRTSDYDPNPQIRVVTTGGVVQAWTAVPALLTESERVSTNPLARHFMVEVNERRIRFGDDVFGAIPETNALITCTRYLLLDGPPVREATPPADHALTVRAGDIHHIVRFPAAPPLPAGVTLDVVDNTDAEGGANFFARSRRFEKGLSQFRTPYRLITKADFERAVLEDFNAFQRLSRSTPEVLNVSVVFDKRPTATSGPSELEDAQSHVTLVPLFAATTVPVAILWERMRRFLDPRRLITTRLNFMAPQYRQVDVNAAVVVAADRNVADVDAALRSRIAGFLSVERGELDGRGWRLGRNVYESQIARVLEETEGVDHVTQLALNPADAQGNVEIAPHQLPQLRTLTLAVGRE